MARKPREAAPPTTSIELGESERHLLAFVAQLQAQGVRKVKTPWGLELELDAPAPAAIPDGPDLTAEEKARRAEQDASLGDEVDLPPEPEGNEEVRG